MKAKRMVAALAAVSLISLGLAACSATGPTKPAGKTAITVEDYFVPPGDPEVDKIYASCAVTTNTKLTVDHVAGAGLIAKVLQQASSKTLPDVLMLDNPDVQQIAASGALVPITNFGLSGKGAAKGTVAASTYKGKLYGLQPIANSIALFYNKDLLSAAGITPPKTWADLTADAKKLTTKTTYGFAFSGINTYKREPGRPCLGCGATVEVRRTSTHPRTSRRSHSSAVSSPTVRFRRALLAGRRAMSTTSSLRARPR